MNPQIYIFIIFQRLVKWESTWTGPTQVICCVGLVLMIPTRTRSGASLVKHASTTKSPYRWAPLPSANVLVCIQCNGKRDQKRGTKS